MCRAVSCTAGHKGYYHEECMKRYLKAFSWAKDFNVRASA